MRAGRVEPAQEPGVRCRQFPLDLTQGTQHLTARQPVKPAGQVDHLVDDGGIHGDALYARLSETYDAAESVPTQLANAERHAGRRGWRVVARFKDDGYSAFKEIRWDDFVNHP
jgi:hypothetical protein